VVGNRYRCRLDVEKTGELQNLGAQNLDADLTSVAEGRRYL
jgi:hypothetical protein